MKLSKLLTLASVVGVLFLQSCGGDDTTSATTAAASSVTISGSMSLSDTTTTGIINSSGVLPLAASGDDYKLYCVGFEVIAATGVPPSCEMEIKAGVFSSICADFGGKPFGCFAIGATDKKVYPLVAPEGLSCSGGGEIELTIIFDTESGAGTITYRLKGDSKKVEVTADQLANLDVWKDGMLYSMLIKPATGKDDILGLPGASAIVKTQQGPPQGQGQKPEDMGPKPGDKFPVFLKILPGDAQKLLVAQADITDICLYDEVKDEFRYTFSNGTNTVVLDLSSLTAYENTMKDALKGTNRVFSAALEEEIMKAIEARVADRFGHCDQLKDENNNPISEDKCVFGYPNPEVFAKADPGDFRAFAKLTAADIIKVSTSDAAGPGPEANTYEPAINRVEYRDENGNFTDDSTKAVMKFSFPQVLNVWCPDPFRGGALNSYPVRLTSETETLNTAQAIARLKTGEDKNRILEDRGCSDTAKNDELRREFGRVIAHLFEFLSRQAEEAQMASAAVIDLEQAVDAQCTQQFDPQKLAEIKRLGAAALTQFKTNGPANKQFEGFKGKDFDPNKNAPPPGGPQFGGAPTDGQQQPQHKPGDPQPLQPQQPAQPILLTAAGPGPGGPQGAQANNDPGIIECAKYDGNKDDFSDDDAKCYMRRFVPPELAVLCALSTALRNELDTIRAKSCIPRGVRVEPVCTEKDVKVTQDGGAGQEQGPAFKGFECEPTLVSGHLSPAAAHDVMSRQQHVLAPLFGFEAFDGPFNRYIDDGTGVPQKCTESFGVQMIGKLPKDGDGKILLKTDIVEGRLAFNDKNTCNERQASEGVDVKKTDANSEMRFTATP